MDVIEAMNSCRAIRYFKPDSIPDETIDRLIHAATRAPSPGNSQGWEFVVITDKTIKSALSESISMVIGMTVSGIEAEGGGMDALDPVDRRMLRCRRHGEFAGRSPRHYPGLRPQDLPGRRPGGSVRVVDLLSRGAEHPAGRAK